MVCACSVLCADGKSECGLVAVVSSGDVCDFGMPWGYRGERGAGGNVQCLVLGAVWVDRAQSAVVGAGARVRGEGK